ncbi:hypothetical protein BJ742DRAFT_226494 [Cladochytrium replicatum]|nr:hypothetical protein BJ742DRAFT_226494 [Cladochytrium replicatum]
MAAAATAATSSTPSFETSSPSTSMNPVVIDDDILLAARVLFNTHLLFLQNVLSNRYDSPPPCDEDDNHSYTLPSPSPPPLLAVSTKKHGSDDPNKRKRKPPKRYEAEEDFEFNATYIMPLRELLPVVHLLNAKSPEPPVATRKPRGPPKPRAMPSPSPKPVVKRRKLDDSANSSGTSSPTPRKANSSRRCTYCFATTTPMWRHGPPGYPDLCNKCGVKWMRGKILQDINKSEVSSEPEER